MRAVGVRGSEKDGAQEGVIGRSMAPQETIPTSAINLNNSVHRKVPSATSTGVIKRIVKKPEAQTIARKNNGGLSQRHKIDAERLISQLDQSQISEIIDQNDEFY